MRERDLRKQALESGKTVSRKARSKQPTPSSSRTTSATRSRVASREGSDDESELSDATQWSNMSASIDEMISPSAEEEQPAELWKDEVRSWIEGVVGLWKGKKASAQAREEVLQGFVQGLARHFCQEEVGGGVKGEVLGSLVKSVRGGVTEKETVLALKGLGLMVVTDPDEGVYDEIAGPVKGCVSDAQHPAAKAAAIHCLGVATFYGGASEEETAEVMEWMLDIVSSDGAVVGEEDNPDIVTAALEEWGFLATQIEDLEDATEAAMETFVEQLDSGSVDVQIAAGDDIALVFEKSYTEAESDDEAPASPEEDDEVNGHSGPRMIKRYDVTRNPAKLQSTLSSLSKESSKRLSKSDRKALHLAFADILNTVEKPTRGPRYSTALDPDGREYGSRLKIEVGGGGRMTIDTWWKLHRLNALKRLLREGFLVHYERNQVVFDTLPVIVEE